MKSVKVNSEKCAAALLIASLLFPLCALSQNLWQAPSAKAQLSEVHYSPLAGGVVGRQGRLREYRLSPDSAAARIVSLQVGLTPREDWRIVQCLRVVYERLPGTPDTVLLGGGDGADWQPAYRLREGQTLTGVSGAGGWFVDAIQFHFSDGAASARFGGAGGDTGFAVRLQSRPDGSPRSTLLGFYGSTHDGLLESIGLVFWPLE